MPQAVSDREEAGVGSLGSVRVFGCRAMKWRGAGRRKGAAARSPPQSGRRRETPRLGRRGARETRDRRSKDLGAGIRIAARPLAGTSLRSCARPSVCAATLRCASAHPPPPMEVYDEQEGFRVYESEVGRLLVGAYLRCRGRRTRGFVVPSGRSKRGLRRQKKSLRRQRKSLRRQSRTLGRILVPSA